MTPTVRMTKPQKRRAYREAVQSSLVEFYQTPEPESKKLVTAWWKRLSDTSAFKSGLFMHSEPINTAADLIDADVVPITSEIREKYRKVLSESFNRVLHSRRGLETVKNVHLKQPIFIQTVQAAPKRTLKAAEKRKTQVAKQLTVEVRG